MVLSNKNNPLLQVDFLDLYPVALSAVQFNNDATDVTNVIANATFAYQIYQFTALNTTAS